MLITFAILMWLTSCSIVKTEFVDVDGTAQKTFLMLAPFSTVDGSIAGLEYEWDLDGDGGEVGKIRSGQRQDRIDQSPQAEAMKMAIDTAIRTGIEAAIKSKLPAMPTSTETVAP